MRTFLAILLFSALLFAQSPDVQRGPIAFAGATSDSAIWVAAGGPNGAVTWRLTYHVDGALFTAAAVAIQGANAATSAGCAAAVWATITTANADLVENANPSVSATQGNVAVKSFYPCIRMTVTAVTGAGGTVTASIAGYKAGFVFPASATIAGTVDVNLKQVNGHTTIEAGVNGTQAVGGSAAIGALPASNPIPAGLIDSAGNLIAEDYCTLKAVVASPGTGNTQLVALSGTKVIRICKISFTTDTLTTVQLVTGTTVKTACDTGATNETAVYSGAGGGVFGVIEDYASPLITTGARNLCIALSAGVSSTGGVTIEYSQR